MQSVCKPIGELKGIAGFSMLGSGAAALILDVPDLPRQAVEHRGRDDSSGAPVMGVYRNLSEE